MSIIQKIQLTST